MLTISSLFLTSPMTPVRRMLADGPSRIAQFYGAADSPSDHRKQLKDALCGLTGDEIRSPNTNDTQIPQTPEVGGVKKRPCVFELAKLIIGEASDPDIQQNFDGGDVERVPFHGNRIV